MKKRKYPPKLIGTRWPVKASTLHVGHKRPFTHPTRGKNGPVIVRKPDAG